MTSVFTPPDGPTMLPGGQPVVSTGGPRSMLPARPLSSSGATVELEDGLMPAGPADVAPVEVADMVIRVLNVGSEPIRQRYLRHWWTIPPGGEVVMPWDVFVCFFGDPRAKNLSPQRMDRRDAYNRIRFKYGALDNDDLWDQNRPRVECFRINGEQITPLCDDPDGVDVTDATMSVAGYEAMQQQIAHLQQQLAAMQSIATAGPVAAAPSHQPGPPRERDEIDPESEALEDRPRRITGRRK